MSDLRVNGARRGWRGAWTVVLVMAALVASVLPTPDVVPPARAAVLGMSAYGVGAVSSPGFGTQMSVDFNVSKSATGTVTGGLYFPTGGFSGMVTCLEISGSSAVVGAVSLGPGGTQYAVVFVTDGGANPADDTLHVNALSMTPPTCTETPDATPSPLTSGGFIVDDGTQGNDGEASADGTGGTTLGTSFGAPTRSFSFSATRDAGGVVAGTFSWNDSNGPFGAGIVTCLRVIGNRAVFGGYLTTGAPGPGTYYVVWHVTAGGAGTGGTLTQSLTNQQIDCTEAAIPPNPLTSGSITLTGGGAGPGGGPVSVAADVFIARNGAFQGDSIRFRAIRDANGVLTGDFSYQGYFGGVAMGSVTCLRVDGPDIVLGGIQPGFNGNPTVYVTMWAHDGDLDGFVNGSEDTIAVDGPTNMAPPDCDATSPLQELVSRGQIAVFPGPSDVGSVVGAGTSDLGNGSGTRTFDIDATRTAGGTVSGTVDISEAYSWGGGFSFAGSVVCLDIRGSSAFIVAERPFQPNGQPTHATFVVTDGGAAGAGDTLTFDTYSSFTPICIGVAIGQVEPLLSGDIAVGDTPPPPPPPTTGLLRWSSPKDTGGLLAGVNFHVTGPQGYDVVFTDNDTPTDREPLDGIVELELPIGGPYHVCRASSPPEWYPTVADCQSTSIATGINGGFSYTHTFVANLTATLAAPVSASVGRYGIFERSFTLSRSYSDVDVFDARRIDVTATFNDPTGATFTVPAFFTKDYVVQPGTETWESYVLAPGANAAGTWRIRFSPDEIGTYTYTIRAQDSGQPGAMVYTSPAQTFTATASTDHGPVGIDQRDGRFLRHRDLTPYYPIGEDIAFEDGNPNLNGTAYYTALLDSLAAADGNWTRIWMTDFNRSALEWSTGHYSGLYSGVGRYSLPSAYRMDRILALAADRGIEVQLVLNDHGQFSTNVNPRWAENPYSSARGGPVPAASPHEFFTNAEAKRLFKQRLRYLVARYGAYRNVLAWELFNEVQFVGTATNNPGTSATIRAGIAAWHTEMAAYLRSIDPYDHLITTSSSPSQTLDPIWADPNIDLVQVHDYDPIAGRDERFRTSVTDLQAAHGKPVLIAEFGLPGGPEDCDGPFDPTTSALPAADIEHLVAGTHLHDSAWTAALSGSMAASWWWGCYMQPSVAQNRTSPDFPLDAKVFPPLAAYLAGEDLANLSIQASAIAASPAVVAFGLDGSSRGYVWVRDALNAYGSGVGPGDLAGRTISGESLTISGCCSNVAYDVQVWDPYTGQVIGSFVATASGGDLVIPLPDFQRDIALKYRWGETTGGTVPAGGSVSTDVGGDGAWPGDPLELTLTSPNAGTVSLSEVTTVPTGSFEILGEALHIDAPNATAANPLRITFIIDPSVIPAGESKDTIVVLRDGTPIADCLGSAVASPDPCITTRAIVGGDVHLVALTSQASDWAVVAPAPTLGPITVSSALVPLGTAVSAGATLTDAGPLGAHVATWTWDDGTTSAGTIGAASGGSATVTGVRTYAAPGVYTASLTVTDPGGQVATREFRYVVVYDPSAGFATGSGTFIPGGPTADAGDLLPGLDGTSPAEFGFVIKYRKGATTIPAGSITFRYAAGGLELSSERYDWLVVTNDNWARFQGLASIAGQPGLHPFRVDARDANRTGGTDRIVIRIWAPGADPATADPVYKASGDVTGQVTIHRK